MEAQTIISVRDQNDNRGIAKVEVELISAQKQTIFRTETNQYGRCELEAAELGKAVEFHFHHPDYQKRTFSLAELQQAEFQILMTHYTYSLDEIVFIANRHRERKSDIPHQIQVIQSQNIRLQNPQTSADLLAQNGQVFVQKSQQGGGSPNLRGFEANKVLLVMDGIRMNNAIYRSGHLQNVISLDPAMIERTEILFGPGSVIYGSDALGGVMHFYTRNPALSNKGKSSFQNRSFVRFHHANRAWSTHTDLNAGFQKWAFLSSISLNRFGDLRIGRSRDPQYPDFGLRTQYVQTNGGTDTILTNPRPYQMLPSAYAQIDLSQKVLFVPNENVRHQLQLQYSTSSNINRFDRLSQMIDGQLRFAEWYYGPQKRALVSYHLGLYRPTKLYDQLDLIVAGQDLEESRVSRAFQASQRNHRIEKVKVGSLNLNLTKTLEGVHELAYGLDAAYNRVNSTAFAQDVRSEEQRSLDTRYPDGGTDWWSLAAYFTHRWEIADRITLTEGIRYNQVRLHSRFVDTSFFRFPFDEIRQINGSLSGNLGLVLKLPQGIRISSLAGSGFRAPNLDDVAKVFDSQAGSVVVPNPNLKPENTYNLELSLSKSFAQWGMLEIVGWHSWYQDAIVLRGATYNGESVILYDGVPSQVQMNLNAGQARIMGLSTNAWWRLGNWRFTHSLTYTYGQDLSNDVPLDHIPPLFGKGALQYANKAWKLELAVPYQGWKRPSRYSPRDQGNADFATADGWPAWAIVNLHSTFALNNVVQLQGGCENIFDLHYRPFSSRISAPGRNLFVALRASF